MTLSRTPHWTVHVPVTVAILSTAAAIGWWLQRHEDLRMTRFRDKSALFGKQLKPGEEPSWPVSNFFFTAWFK